MTAYLCVLPAHESDRAVSALDLAAGGLLDGAFSGNHHCMARCPVVPQHLSMHAATSACNPCNTPDLSRHLPATGDLHITMQVSFKCLLEAIPELVQSLVQPVYLAVP